MRYAEIASTSGEVGDGGSAPFTSAPVAFSLLKKQSVTRSPRLYMRPDRRLYSGNIPATATSGSDFSRCPAFMWQLLHDIPPGARCGASTGVFVKSLNPLRISCDCRESSSDVSVNGFFGNSHAATIVTFDATSGPFILRTDSGLLSAGWLEAG
jgi:hypothetical protein